MKGMMSILRSAVEIKRTQELGIDADEANPFDCLKAAFDLYFKGILGNEMFELYQLLFSQFFS